MKIDKPVYNAFEQLGEDMINFIHDKNLHKGIDLEYSTYHFDQVEYKPVALFIARFLRYHSIYDDRTNYSLLGSRFRNLTDGQALIHSDLNKGYTSLQGNFRSDISYLDEFIDEEKDVIDKAKKTDNIAIYCDQINFVEQNKEKIKAFINKGFKNDNAVDFYSFAEDRLNSNIIDLEKMRGAVDALIMKADQIYFKKLIGLPVDDKLIKEYLKYYFDFKAYKRPLILEQYPNILRNYKVMLKAWLLKETYKRINKLYLDSNDLPQEYGIIKGYADELLDPAEKRYLDENQKPIIDFPQHIFQDQKGYALFKAYNKHSLNKNAELSFLYYQMKDKEKDTDFSIKAAPSDFLDWYISEEDSNPELEIKKDNKASTDERKNIYNMIKSFIMDKYGNA